jgi:hypothetical protein
MGQLFRHVYRRKGGAIVRPLDHTTPVLKAGVIYSGDNGALLCVECAGSCAKYTGHDRSGQKVSVMPYQQTLLWQQAFGKPLACECGKTIYLLPKP